MFSFNRHVENEKRTTLAEITFDKFAQVDYSFLSWFLQLMLGTRLKLSILASDRDSAS
jgi:hypothetical protein